MGPTVTRPVQDPLAVTPQQPTIYILPGQQEILLTLGPCTR